MNSPGSTINQTAFNKEWREKEVLESIWNDEEVELAGLSFGVERSDKILL